MKNIIKTSALIGFVGVPVFITTAVIGVSIMNMAMITIVKHAINDNK